MLEKIEEMRAIASDSSEHFVGFVCVLVKQGGGSTQAALATDLLSRMHLVGALEILKQDLLQTWREDT